MEEHGILEVCMAELGFDLKCGRIYKEKTYIHFFIIHTIVDM